MGIGQGMLARATGQFGPFHPPPHALERPRLLARLEGAAARRLTLIVADSGYGKSTLLAQWGRRVPEIPQAWYTLRTRDALPRNFERHLAAALGHIVALHRPARTVDEALEGLEGDAILVLDDLQLLNDKGMATVKELLDHPLLHLVAASRVPPTLPLSRLRLQGQVIELTAADLTFTPDEVAALGLEGDPDELWAQTQGWPAACALIQFGGSSRSAGSRRELFVLLAEEVWSQLPAEERSILETAGVAGTVTPELAGDLSGSSRAVEVLDGFARRGWLSIASRDRYQCHSLFRDFVLDRMTADDRAALAERAVQWWIDHGNPEEAGGISALCMPAVRRQFLTQYGALLSRSGGATALREAFETLPYDREEPPEVTILRGRLDNLEGRFAEGLDWVRLAQERAFLTGKWRILARASAYEAEILAHRGEYARAALACRNAVTKIDGRDETARAELEGILSWSLFHLGDVDEAMMTLERARGWFEQQGESQQEAILIRRRGAFHSMRGELAEALRWEGMALTRFRQLREPLGEANVSMNLGKTLARAGRYEEGTAQLQAALAVTQRHGLSGMVLQIRLELAAVSAEAGGEIEAIPTALESERDLFLWNLLAARLARRRGDAHKAWHTLGAARALLPQISPGFRARLEAEEAALHLVQEEVDAGLRILEPTVEALWEGPWRVESYLPRLHRAYGRLQMGQEEEARADLTILMGWRTQADLGALWAPEAWAAVPLLEFARRSRLESGFAAALLRQLGAKAPLAAEAPIRVHILGPLQVGKRGTLVGKGDFKRPQVRALLGYVAIHHPRPVPASELVEALWPRASSIEESSLYTTVSRLRRALGRDAVIKDGTGYRLGPEVEVDAVLFGRALAAQPPRWQEAVQLWRGDLLADLPHAEWCFLARDTFRSRFLEAATRHGEQCLAQENFTEARSVFERALESDSFCEPAIQGLMRVLVLTGDAPRAFRLYQRFMEMLKQELGLAPSEETLQLAQRLAG